MRTTCAGTPLIERVDLTGEGAPLLRYVLVTSCFRIARSFFASC
jgi:hypothetical protein